MWITELLLATRDAAESKRLMPRAAAVKLFKSNTVNYLKEDDLLFLRDFVVSTAP